MGATDPAHSASAPATHEPELRQTFDPDVLPLWIAEMDVLLAPPIADAIDAAVKSGDTGYTAGSAFAEAVRDFAADRWQWTIDPSATSIVPDVMRGMTELVRLLTAPGDNVIITPPIYPPFYGFMRSAQRQIFNAPLTPAGRLDVSSLETAFTSATRTGRPSVLLLSNPHNPTGVVHTPDELTAVADLATTHGIRVISDEIHAPLVLPGASFTPYLTIPNTETGFALVSGLSESCRFSRHVCSRFEEDQPHPRAERDLVRGPTARQDVRCESVAYTHEIRMGSCKLEDVAMSLRSLRFFPDWCSETCLWDSADDSVTPISLGLSQQLLARIDNWVSFWEEKYSHECGWPDDSSLRIWMTEGDALTALIRGELLGQAEVQPMFSLYSRVCDAGARP